MEHDQDRPVVFGRAVVNVLESEVRDAALRRRRHAAAEADIATQNALPRIAFEIGLALAIPLTGAMAAGWMLRALGIF